MYVASEYNTLLFQGPFDVCRKVFVGGEETARMTINDKSDLFFHDYQFGPLFVQENYPTVTPRAARYSRIPVSATCLNSQTRT